ncbi:hypothetical protein CR513_50740, partial [Mucuna pruriens]
MKNAEVVSTLLATHFKLNSRHSPSNEVGKTNMSRVPYASVVGSLLYAMMCTTLDIAHAIGREDLNALKWILRYPHSTSDLRLCFGCDKPTLVGYSDSNMVGDIDSRKSTSGYLIKVIVITKVCKGLLWVKKLLKKLGFVQDKYFLFCGSESAIHLGKNPTFHSRSKHIDDAKLLELAKVYTDDNGADMMTKVLIRRMFKACCEIVRLAITYT